MKNYIFTFFSICVWEDDTNDDPRSPSKCDDVVCWILRIFGCFINNCCANVDDVGCPIAVHCFPLPIDPSRDDELEVSDDGIVETPPLLFTCK